MDIQEIAALTLVAIAAGWLALRLWRQARGKAGGGSCPGCGECGRPPRADARRAPEPTPLITLGSAPRRRSSPPTSDDRGG